MNPDTEIIAIEPPTSSPEPATPFAHRGNGKIARFPKPVRDQINHWFLDGLSYPEIIERLGEHGQGLTPNNLSQWRKRGYQDWLFQQTWLAETRARQEPASALSIDFDATQLNHAALQLGSLHIFEALRDLNLPQPSHHNEDTSHAASSAESDNSGDCSHSRPELRNENATSPLPPGPVDLQPNPNSPVPNRLGEGGTAKNQKCRSRLDFRLGGDSAAFVRLMNALARASRETMLVQKYRDACAHARAQLQPLKDPKRKLNDDERRAIVHRIDEILGLRAPDEDSSPANDPPATSADANGPPAFDRPPSC